MASRHLMMNLWKISKIEKLGKFINDRELTLKFTSEKNDLGSELHRVQDALTLMKLENENYKKLTLD